MAKFVRLEWTRTVECGREIVVQIPDGASEEDLELVDDQSMSVVAEEATTWEADLEDESPMTVVVLCDPVKPDFVFDWGDDGQLHLVEDDDADDDI